MGFSQEQLINLGIDLQETLILRWFIDFKDTGKMASEIVKDDKYYWINYASLLKDIPILNINKQNIRRKLKHLCDLKILKHYTKRRKGTFSMYTIGSNYGYLVGGYVKNDQGGAG